MRILISGAGIAGPSLAWWLLRYGFEPVIVEAAPSLRTGGYVIDFWGAGYEIAGRMGLIQELDRRGYKVREVRIVNDRGRRISGFSSLVFDRAMGGRFVSLARGDLASAIYALVDGRVETIFGDTIEMMRQHEAGVEVTLRGGMRRDFDLVVGADGLHSRVREIAFGPQNRFEKYTGLKVAAFAAPGYRPRDELVYVMYTEPGRQIARFAMRGDETMFLLTFRDEFGTEDPPRDAETRKDALRRRYDGCGWEWPEIREALDRAQDVYFDRVSQIRMKEWSSGRVTLLGDAASCVSLLAGEGSGLAMTAASILAAELRAAGGDHAAAFRRYQEKFGPFVHGKQEAGLRFAAAFAPKTRLSLLLRNQVMKLFGVRPLADWIVAREFSDAIDLPGD